ncbi:hypothetical protein ACFOEQ_11095 [Chryseobacterium arachidis]|uniref:hypothetical protein n=1 Tax=Chryseobacterium arachidis TaxID=1416778 RepID=UPI00360ADC43
MEEYFYVQLLLDLQERIAEEVPEIQYIDQQLGQLQNPSGLQTSVIYPALFIDFRKQCMMLIFRKPAIPKCQTTGNWEISRYLFSWCPMMKLQLGIKYPLKKENRVWNF